MAKNTLLIGFLGIVALLLISGCASNLPTQTQIDSGSIDSTILKKAESKKELLEFLEKSSSGGADYYYGGTRMSLAMDSVSAAPMAKMASSESTSNDGGASGSASQYSGTNNQVQGVDEADLVKNDGNYIYTLVQDKLVIVSAYPADNAKVVSEVIFNGTPNQILLNGDHVVVFLSTWEEELAYSQFDFAPRPIGKSVTHAFVYDVSDRSKPTLLKDYDLSGNYYGSRMIGSKVYLITSEYVNYASEYFDTPLLKEGSRIVVRPDVFYYPIQESGYNFNTIISFDMDSEEDPIAKTFMMGYSSALYVSENAIYLASPKSQPFGYYEHSQEERFYSVVVPLLSNEAQNTITALKDDETLNSYEKWDLISTVLEGEYNSIGESAKKDLMERISSALNAYDRKKEEDRQKTIIHKISITDGNIEYVGKGEVFGYLLNQFSMDEFESKLRVATTVELWTAEEYIQHNNVYVLDSGMNQVGSLVGLAPDERIYSTRFIGDRLYMVTFKRVDPFFVIDLSSDDPKVLGELKLPGFSDYLHPYDSNHIIGIGKETAENEWGGVSTKGLKIALFDVSDVSSPKNIAVYSIGDAGTDSEALNDHKALLFDKSKNLLVLPVREVRGEAKFDSRLGYYKQNVWQGAYALSLTPDDGFDLLGKITHSTGDENQWWYYGSPSAVRRSLYMDDVLYTISSKTIKANSLANIKEELATIKLPYEEPRPYEPMPYYKGGVMMSEPAVAID